MPPCANSPGGPPRLVCRCAGVSSVRIAQAMREQNLTELDQVGQATRAGTVCGTCRPEIREMLDELAGRPVPDAEHRLTLQLCESETWTRVEAALFNGVVPQLAPGTGVDLIAVHGLTVNLHVYAGDYPELRATITERLRKLVCSDLEVTFG